MALSDGSLKLLDIIVKGVLGTLITVIATLYGIKLNSQSEAQSLRQQEAQAQLSYWQQKAQEIVNLEAQQKDMDVNIAEDLFKSLSASYFQSTAKVLTSDDIRRRLLLLGMVALNFQDIPVQLRPLFEDLDKQLTRHEDRVALQKIAMDVADRQAFRLTMGGTYNSGSIAVTKGQKIYVPELDPTTYVEIEKVNPDYVEATIVSGLALAGTVGPFRVGFFSWPITDNTKLQDSRLSVTLLEGGEQQAKVRIIVFDSELAPDRFDIKELGKKLREKNHT
jgi:hypothetical protein